MPVGGSAPTKQLLSQIGAVLQSLDEQLRDDSPAESGVIESEIGEALGALDAAARPVATAAAGSREPADLAIRADENLKLARLSFDADGGNAEERRASRLRAAVFHALRAAEQLAAADAATVRVTRDADRVRNDREFLSG